MYRLAEYLTTGMFLLSIVTSFRLYDTCYKAAQLRLVCNIYLNTAIFVGLTTSVISPWVENAGKFVETLFMKLGTSKQWWPHKTYFNCIISTSGPYILYCRIAVFPPWLNHIYIYIYIPLFIRDCRPQFVKCRMAVVIKLCMLLLRNIETMKLKGIK